MRNVRGNNHLVKKRGLVVYRFLTMILFASILLAGCTSESSDLDNIESELSLSPDMKYIAYYNEDDFFRVTLFIEEEPFDLDDAIEVYATVEYIGDEESITIWSGRPYFKYEIIDGNGIYFCEGMQFDELISTQLHKGEIYKIPFQKSGGFFE